MQTTSSGTRQFFNWPSQNWKKATIDVKIYKFQYGNNALLNKQLNSLTKKKQRQTPDVDINKIKTIRVDYIIKCP